MFNEERIERCPKAYIKWLFVVLGMIFAFIIYLVYSNMAGNHISTSSANIVVADNFVLTEHINEEGDYEKPVCKRLEEEGERYSQQDIVLDGKI